MNAVVQLDQPKSLVAKFASRYSVEPVKMLETLKHTAFKVRDGEVTNEQMMALMIVADQYSLNPFTREIFAFPDKGGIVPVVSVDGWMRIINEHPQFDGLEFRRPDCADDVIPPWLECVIFRKDRSHPTVIREYFSEVKRDTQPWKSHPRRMHRHKALIQCARVAFGFAGIYDEDEAARIIEAAPSEKQHIEMPRSKAAVAQESEPLNQETGEIGQAPQAEPPIESPLAGAGPLKMIRKRLADTGKDEAEFCERMGISALEELRMSQVNDALAITTE